MVRWQRFLRTFEDLTNVHLSKPGTIFPGKKTTSDVCQLMIVRIHQDPVTIAWNGDACMQTAYAIVVLHTIVHVRSSCRSRGRRNRDQAEQLMYQLSLTQACTSCLELARGVCTLHSDAIDFEPPACDYLCTRNASEAAPAAPVYSCAFV